MAVELWSENCGLGTSPRISFSHDLSQCDVVPVEQHVFRSDSIGIEFDFCVLEGYEQESSSADELFSDGKILPTEIKKKLPPPPPPEQRPALPPPPQDHPDVAKITGSESDEKKSSKSFWRFKRSSSLKCSGSGYARTLCPLPLLSRSNSTGSSAASVKRSSPPVKSHFGLSTKTLQSSSSSVHQKPPLKKSYGSYSGGNNGVRMNPVLNVHSGNLFGLGSIFSCGKERNKRK